MAHRWGKVVPETGVEKQKCQISPLNNFLQIRVTGGIEHFDLDKKVRSRHLILKQ